MHTLLFCGIFLNENVYNDFDTILLHVIVNDYLIFIFQRSVFNIENKRKSHTYTITITYKTTVEGVNRSAARN